MDAGEHGAAQTYFDELASDVAARLRAWIHSIRADLTPGRHLWIVNDGDTVRFGAGGTTPPARRGRGGEPAPELVLGGTFELDESTLYPLLDESFSRDQLTLVCKEAASSLISELDLWSMHWVTGSDRRPEVSTNSILGKTPLARAVCQDDQEAIDTILATTAIEWNEVSATGMFHIACASGNFAEMERWRALGASIADEPKLLARAAGDLDVALVDWLLEHGADPRILDRKRSALHRALAAGEHDERVAQIVQRLLDAGADPNLPDPQYWNRTPLMQVARYGPVSAAGPVLAAGGTVSGTDSTGIDVVEIAVDARRFELLPIFAEHGADISAAQQLLATAFRAHGEQRYSDVARVADELLESWPQKPEAHILALTALCKTGQSEQALPRGLASLAQNFDEGVMSAVVLAYAKLGEFSGARDLWRTYRDRLDPTSCAPLIVGNLLHIYAANDEGRRAYRELLPWVDARDPEESPDYALLCFNGACAFAQMGESDNAVRLLRMARIAGYPRQQIEDEHDLAPIRGHLLYAALLTADDPSQVPTPQRTVSAEMAEFELGRLLQRAHEEASESPSEHTAALLLELGDLIRRPAAFLEQLEAQLLECFELWQSRDHAPDYDKPLAAVLLQWPGSETMPFGCGAMSYGFASVQLPAQLHLGRPRFGGLLFEALGDVDLAPAVERFGDALETDSALRDCDALESAFCFTAALMLGRACERAVKSATYARLCRAPRVHFFLQQHSQEPQLFFVATAASTPSRRLSEN